MAAPKAKVKVKGPKPTFNPRLLMHGPGEYTPHPSTPATPSAAEQHEHEGRTPQPGVPIGPRDIQQPSASGYEYPATAYQTAGVPVSAAPHPAAVRAEVRQQKAEARQAKLVNRYVTKAYKAPTSASPLAPPSVDAKVAKAAKQVSAARQSLLNHPAVQAANAQGKVVGVKGLAKISNAAAGAKALEGPKGLSHTPLFGTAPRSLRLTPEQAGQLAHNVGVPQGSAGRAAAKLHAHEQEASESSPLDSLAHDAAGLYKTLRLQQPGAGAADKFVEGEAKNAAEAVKQRFKWDLEGTSNLHTPTGKELQLLSNIPAGEGAAKVAEGIPEATRAAIEAGKTGVTVAKALRHAPSEAADVLRAAPAALKATPQAIKDALKATPDALKGAAKAAPKATGKAAVKGAVGTAENSAKAFSGLSLAATVNRAGGGNVPVAKNLEALGVGTGEALRHHPLETLETTGRTLPAFFTAPEAVGEAGIESALQGSTKPLTNTLGALAGGTKELGEELFSGNPKEVEESVRKKSGVSWLLPAPALLHQFHGSDLYTATRGKVRGAVENSRSAKRASAVEGAANDGLTAPKERGRLGSRHEKNVLKPPVPVQGTGEHYVFRGLGEHIGAHHDRAQQALDATRASETAHGWNQIEMNRLRKAAHGAPPDATGVTSRIKGRLKGEGAGFGMSPLAKDMGRSYEALAPVLAKYGLPHSPKGVKLLEELRDYHGAPADITRPDKTINDRIATNEGTKRPEILADQRHHNLTNELRAGQKRLAKELPGNYEPKPFRIQNDFANHLRAKEGKPPILKDTERVTKRAEDILGKKPDGTKWYRDEAWQKYEDLKASESTLRREARDARGRGEQAQADDLYKQARATAKQRKALYGEISKFSRHPGKIDSSSLPGSGRAMKRDFVNEQRAANKELGLLEPVHIHDEVPRAPGSHSSGGVKRDLPGRVTHFSTGEIARSGEADARLESVLHSSAIAPRTQIALNDLIHTSINDLKTPVRMPDGSYKHIATEAERKWAEDTHHMPAGTEWFPTPLLKAALNGAHDLSSADALRMIDEVRSAKSEDGIVKLVEKYPDLRDEIMGHNGGKGLTYTAIRSAGMDELVSQLKGVLPSKLRAIANVPSRLVLNDPAWVFAQLFATGIPIAAALGPSALIRAPQAIKAMSDIQKMDPASQARIKAMIGSSAGVMGTPHTAFSNSDPYAPARAIKHSGFGQGVWKLANGETMGKWDRWNASKMREFAATVRASKGFKNWYGGVKGLDKGMRVISDATKGMNAAQRLDYISRHPALARDLQRNLNKIGGNWNSFTKTERAVAPFVIFYPWIRYSTVWVLHTFPVNHPVAATALAFLAQRNSNELQKIAAAEAKATGVTGVTYSSPLDSITAYSNPVRRNAKDEPVENPSGSRMSPLGVVGQTVLEGNLLKTLGATNPWINTGVSLATNTNTFTNQKLPGHGLLGILENAAEQAASLSPAVRQLENSVGFHGFSPHPQSATSKAYEILKPNKNWASFVNPYTPRPASAGALENALNTIEQRIGTTGHSAQSEAQGDETKTIQDRQKIVAKLKATNKKAWTEKEKLLRKIGGPALAKQSQEEYERYTAAGEEPASSKSAFEGSGFGESSGKSPFESSGFGGSGNRKALNYKPPSESLHLPSVSLPGGVGSVLGSVTSPLASLVGGAPAQAADYKGPAKPLTKAQHHEVLAEAHRPKLLASLHQKTLGTPSRKELIQAGRAGKLRFNSEGKITTPRTRQVQKRLETAQTLFDKKSVPSIEGFEHQDQKEFAEWFSHYTKIPPKLAGEWVKQEGGGFSNGGEAGEQNWLGVGYPAHPTSFSQSSYFNHTTPKAAAKASAEWLEGKIGGDYAYQAASSIVGISHLAKSGASEQEIRSYIEGPSAWGTGAINTGGTISVSSSGGGAPAQVRKALKAAEAHAKKLGIPVREAGSVEASPQTIHVEHLAKRVARSPIVRKGTTGTIHHAGGSVVVGQTSDGPANVKKGEEPEIVARLLLLSKKTGKPVYIISGARTPQHSVEVGGFPDDPHTEGKASDIGVGAPTLASAAAVPESVYESVGLYRPFGTAQGGSSAEDNHVQLMEGAPNKVTVGGGSVSAPSSAPSYTTSSGAPTPAAITAYAASVGKPVAQVKKELKTKKLKPKTLINGLRQVERIYAGNLGAYGIPGFSTGRTTSSGPSLATLSSDRQALGKL